MKTTGLNLRHLYHFWIVAKEGSVTRAAERQGLAIQTISAQLSLLEKSVGRALLAPKGRRLVLTDAGRVALGYAEQIFALAEQMQDALALAGTVQTMRLTVGISDSLPKLIASRVLDAALQLPHQVKLVCFEDRFEALLGALSLHKLDVVLTDRPVPPGTNLKVFSHLLGESELTFFGIPVLAKQFRAEFPKSLRNAPVLLPTRNNALRGRIDQWFDLLGVRPNVVGEFDDNALLNTFGGSGLGLFPAPSVLATDVHVQFGAEPVGAITQVREQFYAVSSERKIKHPAIDAILSAIHGKVFAEEKPGAKASKQFPASGIQ